MKADADSNERPPKAAHSGQASPEVGNSTHNRGAVTRQEQIGNQHTTGDSIGENGVGGLHQHRNLGNSEALWQRAYDKLERDNPDLVKQFKTLFIHIAEPTNSNGNNEIEGNRETLNEEAVRCAIAKGLERIEEYDAVMEAAGEVVDIILGCKDLISVALTAVPQVAAVWTGMTLVLQVNPNLLREYRCVKWKRR